MELQPCGHPTTRIAPPGNNGKTFCRDCRNARYRDNYANGNHRRTTINASLDRNSTASTPSRDVLNRALCGDLADPRYTLDPKHLDDTDRAELAGVCGNCPVQTGCKQWADRDREFEGVAGGHTYRVVKVGNTGRREVLPLLPEADVA